eukprot:706497-Pleurochrysis_carterae.AAC.2
MRSDETQAFDEACSRASSDGLQVIELSELSPEFGLGLETDLDVGERAWSGLARRSWFMRATALTAESDLD